MVQAENAAADSTVAAARLLIVQVVPIRHLPIITDASCLLKVGSDVPGPREGLQSHFDEHIKGSQLRECVKDGLPQVAVTAALSHHLQATKTVVGVIHSGAQQPPSDSSLDSSVPSSTGQGRQRQVRFWGPATSPLVVYAAGGPL